MVSIISRDVIYTASILFGAYHTLRCRNTHRPAQKVHDFDQFLFAVLRRVRPLTPLPGCGTFDLENEVFFVDYSAQYEIIRDSHPVLKFCRRFDETSSCWDFSRHSHPYLELMFFLEGTASIDISGTQLSVSLYDTVVYPAHCLHLEDPSPDLKREIICLWVDLPELVLEETLQIQDRDNRLANLFLRIHEEYHSECPTPFLLEYELKALLSLALRFAEEGSACRKLPRAMQYIHIHYTQRISLDTLADLEHISKSYLSRQFKAATGQTVIEYVNHLRIEMAKHLLVTTDGNIADIAYQVGYESPKYFYRTFRRLCAQSPAAFRQQHQSRKP